MTVAQFEHTDTFTESLPAQDTLDRMEQLFTDRRREIVLAKNRRYQLALIDTKWADTEAQSSDRRNDLVNQITQCEAR